MDSAGSTDPCVAPPAFAHCRDRRGSAVLIVALMAVVAAARSRRIRAFLTSL